MARSTRLPVPGETRRGRAEPGKRPAGGPGGERPKRPPLRVSRLLLLLALGATACGAAVWWAQARGPGSLNALRQLDLPELEDRAQTGKDRVAALCVMGERYEDEERAPEAVAAYSRAKAIEPDSIPALAGYVVSRAGVTSPGWAEIVLRKLVKAAPGQLAPELALGELYLLNNVPEQAGQPFHEAARLGPDDAEVLYQFGVWSGTIGEPGRALESIGKACRLAPRVSRYHLAYADLLIHLARYSQAKEALLTVERLDARSPVLHYHMGRLLLSGRPSPADRGEGLRRLEQSLLLAPGWELPRIELACYRTRNNEVERGVRELEALARSAPANEQVVHALAQGYYRLGRTADGDRLTARYNRLLERGRTLDAMRETARRSPGKVQPRLRLARALRAQGLQLGALALYREILELQPSDPEAQKAVHDLTQPPR
jgi:tetratricopeptide (TPR) repeat protein